MTKCALTPNVFPNVFVGKERRGRTVRRCGNGVRRVAEGGGKDSRGAVKAEANVRNGRAMPSTLPVRHAQVDH